MTQHHANILEAGARAPDFELHATPDQLVSLDDFRGKTLIIAFYPADWSPVCGDQMALYNEILPVFHKHGAELVSSEVVLYEDAYRLCYIRGPEGLLIGLAQELG